ncbi:MAG: hypothetical protein GC159_09710 [Phycisphaera sp.]|nr:hypothetical protein [Phycisphaera sp.]
MKLSKVKRRGARMGLMIIFIIFAWVGSIFSAIHFVVDPVRDTPQQWLGLTLFAVLFVIATALTGWAILWFGKKIGPCCPHCGEPFVWIDPDSKLGKDLVRQNPRYGAEEGNCSVCGEKMIDLDA